MNSIKCTLTKYNYMFFILYNDGRCIKEGDTVVHSFGGYTFGKVREVLSGYDYGGLLYIEYISQKVKVPNTSIIAVMGKDIAEDVKKNFTEDCDCYLFELNGEIVRNPDKTVLLSFDNSENQN